jgi:hypothetical protein
MMPPESRKFSGGKRMPAKSQRQRAWAFANKGAGWAKKHHFNNKGKLPKTSKGGKKKK